MTDQNGDQNPAAAKVTEIREAYASLRREIGKVIVGQDEVIDQILMCLFCQGHGLVVGVPGLGKTLLISTIARALNLEFSRVQFTPDLMPSDITGTEVIEEDRTTGHRAMRFVQGPVFANVVLADEINRTPPKTQAALLESMQERQVTVGGVRHALPSPFFVLATQNPIEQEGTYPLPEAQLDRFMFQISIGYPTEAEELEVVRRSAHKGEEEIEPVLDGPKIMAMQRLIKHVPVSDSVIAYALRLVRTTRTDGSAEDVPEVVRSYVAWGAGPRASESLIHAAKAKAILGGSDEVTFEHVRAIAAPVLRHRILLNFNAEADRVSAEDVVRGLVESVSTEGGSPEDRRRLDEVTRSG